MDSIILVLSVMLFLSFVTIGSLTLAYALLRRKYAQLQHMDEFYDNLTIEMIAISEGIVSDTNKFFNENLIASIPELSNLITYVRKMRDMYRAAIIKYNAENPYRNRIIIEELTGGEAEKEEGGQGQQKLVLQQRSRRGNY